MSVTRPAFRSGRLPKWTHPRTKVDRPSSWRTFVKSLAAVIAAADYFTTEVRTARGLVTHSPRFVIGIAKRLVHIAGTTVNPSSSWMARIARNLTDCVDCFLKGKRGLIIDRDALFSSPFQAILRSSGTKIVPLIADGSTMSEGREEVRDRLGELLKCDSLGGGGGWARAIKFSDSTPSRSAWSQQEQTRPFSSPHVEPPSPLSEIEGKATPDLS